MGICESHAQTCAALIVQACGAVDSIALASAWRGKAAGCAMRRKKKIDAACDRLQDARAVVMAQARAADEAIARAAR